MWKMKTELIKYTKKIARKEGFDNVNVKFCNLYFSGKKAVLGECSRKKKIIKFCMIFTLPYKIIEKIYSKPDMWETMLHEVCHLKEEKPFEVYIFSDLKKNEYIDWQHNLAFWKELRSMKKRYSGLKNKFMIELQNEN